MAESEERQPTNDATELDGIQAQIADRSAESLAPLLEEVCEWLTKLLPLEITPENFLDVLDTGVSLIELLLVIQAKAAKHKLAVKVPHAKIKCHKNASKESFFARENASQFLNWCREAGIEEATLFESDGLVLHRQQKNVVLTLLELARYATQFGIEPPGIVKLEKQIEIDESRKQTGTSEADLKDLDAEVRRLAIKYKVKIKKVKAGKYIVEDKISILVRILRHHVMVRVGGGWDTLENFLIRHSPEKIGKVLIATPQGRTHGKLIVVNKNT